MWAAETVLIRRLEAEWRVLAPSRWLRDRLRAWAVEDDRLAFDDGDQLMTAAQLRNAASWAQRDQVLAALLERADEDAVARRVALQVVLPGVRSLIDGVRGWDVEERAARVVATTVDVLAWCAAEPAGTPPSFRVYANTRRRVLRSALRDRSEPVVFVGDYTYLETRDDPPHGNIDTHGFDDLVEWVKRHGRIREDAARLVVLTRAAGVSVEELASARNVVPQTLRQRRLRAERRVRRGLSLSSGISDPGTQPSSSHTLPAGRTAR
jgi:hypothetical protein